jgi:glutathione S-transferase
MTITLYDMPASGHCHRVRLFLSILGLDYEKRPMSTRVGKTMPADYVALNPLGQVPTLIDGDVVITDSTAALVYLAKKYGDTHWLPDDPAGAGAVQRWLSTASGELYRGPAACRARLRFGRELDLEAARGWAIRLFDWMQQHLEDRQWLAAEHATIADLAMYAYIRVADEGGLDIEPYPAITRWLSSVEALDGFEAMPREE